MNRDDYMDGRVDHHTFYLAIADAIGRPDLERLVRYIAMPEQIGTALETDAHLNNIPLHRWDSLHDSVLQLVREGGQKVMAVSWSQKAAHNLKPKTVCWSLSESVCVLKAVAREMARYVCPDGPSCPEPGCKAERAKHGG